MGLRLTLVKRRDGREADMVDRSVIFAVANCWTIGCIVSVDIMRKGCQKLMCSHVNVMAAAERGTLDLRAHLFYELREIWTWLRVNDLDHVRRTARNTGETFLGIDRQVEVRMLSVCIFNLFSIYLVR